MPPQQSSSVRSRQVSAELRRLREEAGLSGAEVAHTLGMSPSKISRIETGNRGLHVADVAALLGLYRVAERRREELLDLVRRSDEQGWWQSRSNSSLSELTRSYIDFESRAVRIRNYELAVVPGLLQTAEYTAALIEGLNPSIAQAQLDNLVATRMARQAVLRRTDLDYQAVVDECVLHRPVGGDGVLRRQVRHMAAAMERPGTTLRVLPIESTVNAGLRGAFVLFDFSDEPSVVHVEHQYTCGFLEEKAEVAAHREAWADIINVCLPVEDSKQLMRQVAGSEE